MVPLAVLALVLCWSIVSEPVRAASEERDPQNVALLDQFRRLLTWSAVNDVTPVFEDSVEDDDYPDDQASEKAEGERGIGGHDVDDIETVPENTDLDDPVQLAIALNAMSKTIFFNEEGEQRPRALLMRDDGERSGELDDAATADKLIDQSHSLHLAPGENRVPLALFIDAYAEELAFPTIYMGVPRKIIGPRSTPFAMPSSEIRRTDQRGATPEHVLYMATKVMRYNVAESNMMFRNNETTGSITREQLESGGKKFLEKVLDRDLVFMRGVPNTVQYRQDRRIISTTRGLSCDTDPRAVSSAMPQPDAVFARVYAEFLAVECHFDDSRAELRHGSTSRLVCQAATRCSVCEGLRGILGC
ncbi:hypothetical protein MRX96_051942 [Rhipicephalus microplus]